MSDILGSESVGESPSSGGEPNVPQLGRISGKLLSENLVRHGVDLAFNTDLLYLKVSPIIKGNSPIDGEEGDPNYDSTLPAVLSGTGIGINIDTPGYDLEINNDVLTTNLISTSDAYINNFYISNNRIGTSVGNIEIFTTGKNGVAVFDRLASDYLTFDGNVIASVDNSNIRLNPSGTGTVELTATTNVDGDLNVTGNINITGNLSKQGNLIIGDDVIDGEGALPENDKVDFNVPFSQDLLPGQDNAYDLGGSLGDSTAGRWANAFIPDWTNIQNIIPSSALVSDQIRLGDSGSDNVIQAVQSNDDLVIDPATGIVYIEDLSIYPAHVFEKTAEYDTYDEVLFYNNMKFTTSKDGYHLFGLYIKTIYHYDLTTPFDYDSRTNETASPVLTSIDSTTFNIIVSDDGTKIYISGRTSTPRYISEITLTTPWDVTTATFVTKHSAGSSGGPAMNFNEDGTKFYWWNGNQLVNSGGLLIPTPITQYNLTTPWTLSGGYTATTVTIGVEGLMTADYTDGLVYTNPASINYFFNSVAFYGDYAYFIIQSTFSGSSAYVNTFGKDLATLKIVKYLLNTPGDLKSGGTYQSTRQSFNSSGLNIAYFFRTVIIMVGNLAVEDEQILWYYSDFQATIMTWEMTTPYGIVENKDTSAPLTLSSTGTGYYKFAGTNAMLLPVGTDASRPSTPEIGDTRWNTTQGILECFDGTVYVVATGAGIEVTQTIMEDLGHVYTLMLG